MPIGVEEISRILLKKLRKEELDREESATLAEWERLAPENKIFLEMFADEHRMSEKLKMMFRMDGQRTWKKIENELKGEWEEKRPLIRRMSWIKYAAAGVLLLLAVAGYYLLRNADIDPGGSKATLTLASGTVVDLAHKADGKIESVAGVEIMKVKDGQLEYRLQKNSLPAADASYNLLTTPRAGEYQVKLPDGSRVWLNAASSIRFPVSFVGNERNVEVQGEAYFEVAKDPSKKFSAVIKSADGARRGIVEVMGTRFAIRAYGEEKKLSATLLEGSVKVAAYPATAEGAPTFLNPGQQAQWEENNTITVIEAVDTSQFVSWKDGIETFKNSSTRAVMQYISRWYDVDVDYADNVPDRGFSGSLDRSYSLSEALEVLQSLGYRFKRTGRKLTVLQ